MALLHRKSLVAVFAAVLAHAAVIHAAEVTVSSLDDLAATIADTANYPNGSVITLAASATPYDVTTLAAGKIVVNRAITVRGATDDPRDTVITGGGANRCIEITAADAIVMNLTVTNGVPQIDRNNQYFGGGFYITSGVASNCVVTGCFFDDTCFPSATIATIEGVGVYTSGTGEIVNSLIENCAVDFSRNASNGYVQGGGLSGRAIRCTIRNCTLVSNLTKRYIGGAGAYPTYLEGCEIYGNTVSNTQSAAQSQNAMGAGLYTINTGTTPIVTNCVIHSNFNWAQSNNSGGGGVGGGITLKCCTITNNFCAGYGGAARTYDTTRAIRMENCLVADNRAAYGGVMARSGMIAVGCMFSNNTATAEAAIGNVNQNGGIAHFTNCLFVANGGVTYGINSNQPLTLHGCRFENHSVPALIAFESEAVGKFACIEQCVFVNNTSNPLFRIAPAYAGDAFIDNCTFYGNSAGVLNRKDNEKNAIYRNNLVYQDGEFFTAVQYNNPSMLSNNYVKASTHFAADDPYGNMTLATAGEPRFTDAASGNFSLKSNSPLKGKGVVCDWMQGGATLDAGSGTYTIDTIGEYGVCYNPGKASHRIPDGASAPSIGAFECQSGSGLSIFVR